MLRPLESKTTSEGESVDHEFAGGGFFPNEASRPELKSASPSLIPSPEAPNTQILTLALRTLVLLGVGLGFGVEAIPCQLHPPDPWQKLGLKP